MTLQLHDLSLDDLESSSDGKPLLLPIETIDEDPDQPRIEFDAESLSELASTIAERGVRQPISVRPHPDVPGRWRLNFGARRLRASKAAGKRDIPAFVDDAADQYDQVIENEQREKLTVLEMSLFIARRLRAGEVQAEIARRLGKSRQYVMVATALIDAPDWLMAAYREGRCRGLNELHELRRLHGQHPQAVVDWLGTRTSVTRSDIDVLKGELAQAPNAEGSADQAVSTHATRANALRDPKGQTARSSPRYRLMAAVDGAEVEVLLQRSAAGLDEVVVCRGGDSRPMAVKANSLERLTLVPCDRVDQSGSE
jgi:ParB family chromosome partitioning protein